MIAEVTIDPLVALGCDLGRLTPPRSMPKQTPGAPFIRYLWRHVCLKSMSCRLLVRIIPYKHKRSTSKIVNDVNCSLFLIVHFYIPLTSFNATWHGPKVCNDAHCTFSSRRHITKHAQYLESSPSPRRLQLYIFMVFDVLTLILSIK